MDDITRSPKGLGAKIEQLAVLRDKKKELNNELKEVDEQFKALEQEVMHDLDEQGLAFSGGHTHRVTISEQSVPTVDDWHAVEQWAKDNDALYLFQRRLSATAWRELQDAGELVPGTTPFVQRSLSLRKL
jgi:trimethylamine:corrinoid methyltransferase-like protein